MMYVNNNPARSSCPQRVSTRKIKPVTLADLTAIRAKRRVELDEMTATGNAFGMKMRRNMLASIEAEIAAMQA